MGKVTNEEFREFLLKAIDDIFEEIFGKTAAHVIYGYLENNYSLKREEIPEKLEVFDKALYEFLHSGVHVVEQAILRKLYSSLGLTYESKEGYGFVDYMDELKKVLKGSLLPFR